MPSFSFAIRAGIVLSNVRNIHLSMGRTTSLPPKKVASVSSEGHLQEGRLLPDEHLELLFEKKRINEHSPLLVISVRNLLSNLRCIGYVAENKDLACVTGEQLGSPRPYHVLGKTWEGEMVMEELSPNTNSVVDRFEWFLSGVPVLWDNEDPDTLLTRLVPEVADPSHIWHIPRGGHPQATRETNQQWETLHSEFLACLSKTRNSASERLQGLANRLGLKRESAYAHNIIGLDGQRNLCQLVGSGQLEQLGREFGERYGAGRALVVDNGGSITTLFYPSGLNGPNVQLVAMPNHRPRGTAYLVAELGDALFLQL